LSPVVSIHAPVKGATKLACSHACYYAVSIRAPHQEGGAIPSKERTKRKDNIFNPRPREGATEIEGAKAPKFVVSIHAPKRGATRTP
jgi:hypothetical protein